MQQIQMMSGFSELKELLINTFQIEKSREKVRIYFTEKADQLLMHDYHNHQNYIVIVRNIARAEIMENLGEKAKALCTHATRQPNPMAYLNQGFLSYGYFRF